MARPNVVPMSAGAFAASSSTNDSGKRARSLNRSLAALIPSPSSVSSELRLTAVSNNRMKFSVFGGSNA